eukprot:997511-Rhodomonas_salina.1
MQAVPNSTWRLLVRGHEQPACSKHWHSLWSLMHRPFVLPPWAVHTHEWQVYDATQAGCVLCGQCHWCDPGSCATVACEDGARVCPITAYCIPCIRTCDQEYSDCQNMESSHRAPVEDTEVLATVIEVYVRQCICGALARGSLQKEYEVLLGRRVHTLLRVCRRAKQRLGHGVAPNMIDIVAEMHHSLQRCREPLLLPDATLDVIAV